MTPFFLNKLSSFPPADGDQDQSHLHVFPSTTDCSSPYTFLFNNPHVEGAASSDHHRDHHKVPPQQEPNEHLLVGGLRDQPESISYYTKNHNDFDDGSVKHSLYDQHVREDKQHGPAKWMSSKMRFMRKMMDAGLNVATKPRRNRQVSLDQKYPNQEISSDSRSNNNEDNFPTGVLRVCSSCNTTKTPLWRSGPQGPKSLCNACGIRQRKARRAMAAATVSGGLISIDTSSKTQKEKISDVDRTVPLKKRCNIATTGATATAKKLRLDDIMINLGKTSAFHQVFPQDEKDAAILLMGLSCGLTSG